MERRRSTGMLFLVLLHETRLLLRASFGGSIIFGGAWILGISANKVEQWAEYRSLTEAGSGMMMRNHMACLFVVSAFCLPTFAMGSQERVSEEQVIAQLEQRAAEAPDREQCYIYAELVHEMVKYSANQYASGQVNGANSTLKHMQGITSKIRILLGGNTKKLKAAQILLRRAAYRLTDLLHVTSYEDRKLVQDTLAMVQEAEKDVLSQVFRK